MATDFKTIRLPRELANRIDEARPSTVSRDAFVRRAVEAALDGTSLTRAAATPSRVSVTEANLERQAKLNKDKDKRN